MIYKQFKPHAALLAYIDAYWTSTAGNDGIVQQKLLPDGCVDIIINLGENFKTDSTIVQHEKAYLVGTMLRFKTVELKPGRKLLGIRFKPAAFSAFYQYTSLHQVTDLTVEFEKKLLPDLKKIWSIKYLDQFFLNRLQPPKHSLFTIIDDIKNHQGQVSVTELARRHFITTRQLERQFKQYIGASPKEFINFLRYQFVAPVIQNRLPERSLLDIAFDHGYYDHAHLANEVKRYTGVAPTILQA